jgi:FkbM family methyltransferase
MQIFYGASDRIIEITEICFSKLLNNVTITIPAGDLNRAKWFNDPFPGIKKKVFVLIKNVLSEHEDNYQIIINVIDRKVSRINENYTNDKLTRIQSSLKLNYGSFMDELPEQKMAVRYLTGNEKVLEIGGNIGRNSLVIASILKEKNNVNFVSLESDPEIANQLIENRNINQLPFYIESSALSKRKLIQMGWNTMVSDTLEPGCKWVNTITWEDLNKKYNIVFDTLVLDCEGAFYYILKDTPEILDKINLIIMENDYLDIYKKDFIDDHLIKTGFYRDYVEGGGWGPFTDNFFEVWKKV